MNAARVKICGLTSVADARLAVALGAGYLGLNFYPPSPRCVSPERGREIADAVRDTAVIVGVFVNRPAAEIAAIDRAVGLDLIQLHGDEGPAEVAPWGERAIKVFRTRGELAGIEPAAYPRAWGFLFDLLHDELYGGSGEGWRYEALADLDLDRPFFIAGGITPATVRRAAAVPGSYGVDVCSGVEAAPGRKDPDLLRELFHQLRHPAPTTAPV